MVNKNLAATRKLAQNAALLIASLGFIALLFLIVEAAVRLTTDIPFLGNSANLFTSNAFGASRGNTKNAEAVSMGVKVYTDANGFRVSRNHYSNDQPAHDRAIMVLGDSVGFGTGVEFEKTFAGRLAAEHPKLHVYNTSVIGYAVNDYKNLIDAFFTEHAGEISHVLLLYCLNDISELSATNIDTAVTAGRAYAERSGVRRHTETPGETVVDELKRWRLINWVNEYLRSRSKLYVLVKGMITDPQARYWEADLRAYRQLTSDGLIKVLEPLGYIADVCRRYEVPFNVIILPYEYQVRVDDESTRVPQRMLSHFFEKNQIHYIDALPLFRQRSDDAAKRFLPYDPMHLSSQGHALLYELISGILNQDKVVTDDAHG